MSEVLRKEGEEFKETLLSNVSGGGGACSREVAFAVCLDLAGEVRRLRAVIAEQDEQEPRGYLVLWGNGVTEFCKRIDPRMQDAACAIERCYTAPPAPKLDVDWLAGVIREVDGNHTMGAGALAEAICEAIEKSARGE